MKVLQIAKAVILLFYNTIGQYFNLNKEQQNKKKVNRAFLLLAWSEDFI